MNDGMEQGALFAAIHGKVLVSDLKPYLKTFSQNGKKVAQALTWLGEQGEVPPYGMESVTQTCTQICGHDDAEISTYMRELRSRHAGPEITAILRGAVEKFKLIQLSQLAITQMTTHKLDAAAFQDLLVERTQEEETFVSLWDQAQTWNKEDRDGTTRLELGRRFRQLQEATGGLGGFWVVGGPTGVGKSTLVWQLCLVAGVSRRVLYYDLENTPKVLYHRTVESCGDDLSRVQTALNRVSVRTNIRDLFQDVAALDSPGVIVVDSIQKLPSDIHYKQSTMEDWLARLDRLKLQGHIVIVVSQLNRSAGEYKGTNDLEHTADVGLKLDADPGTPNTPDVYVVKNRHLPFRGFLCQLRREHAWTFTE